MKTSTLTCATAVVVQTLLYYDSAEGLFLGTLALLPFSALASLGGLAGLKLAIAMKLLGHLGWWKVSRHGVGLRASIQNDKLPERFVPEPPKPHHGIFGGPTIRVPLALIPYFLGGHGKKWSPFKMPGSDFALLVDHSGNLDSSKVKFRSRSSAGVDGTKGSFLQASGNLKSPVVNVAAKKIVAKVLFLFICGSQLYLLAECDTRMAFRSVHDTLHEPRTSVSCSST